MIYLGYGPLLAPGLPICSTMLSLVRGMQLANDNSGRSVATNGCGWKILCSLGCLGGTPRNIFLTLKSDVSVWR